MYEFPRDKLRRRCYFVLSLLLVWLTKLHCFSKVLVPAVFREFENEQRPESLYKFSEKYNYTVFLYQKLHPDQPNYIRNVGTEGAVYLKYIVDHYDNFPDVAIFTHATPETHQPDWLAMINCISANASYLNFNFHHESMRSTSFW